MSFIEMNEVLFFRAINKINNGNQWKFSSFLSPTTGGPRIGSYELFNAAVFSQYDLKGIKEYLDTSKRLLDAYREKGELPNVVRSFIKGVISGEHFQLRIGENTMVYAL